MHAASENKLFNRLVVIGEQLFELELVKLEIEHKHPNSVPFFSGSMRMLELYFKFSRKFCEIDKWQELA